MPPLGASNHHNPRGHEAEGWVIAFCILAFVLVVARVLTRFFVVRNPGYDDLAICIAWVFNLGLNIGVGFEVRSGMGLHMDELTNSDKTSLMKSFWVCIWIYNVSLFWTKLALILQYLRLFTQPWFRKAAFALLVFVCLSSCWTIVGSILSCVPINGFWDPNIKAYCLPRAITWYLNAGLNVATDMLIILLPMPVLKGLKMPFRQRLALMGVFALGLFVCITSFVRIKNLHDISSSEDVSFANVNASTWSGIESSTSIICASLPALKATITRFFPRLFPSSNSASRSNPARNQYIQTSAQRSNFGTGKIFSRNDRSKSSATNPMTVDGDRQFSELRTLDRNGRTNDSSRHLEPEGKIGVTTVMEQQVMHLNGLHKDGYPTASNSSAKDESDTGSEKGLVILNDYERPRNELNHNFTHYRP
ncbi:hypothetical protein K461DRAFT_294670 [Myriangium duriaei CBS 260.36]|uniref:Rhodopsin domain-containing protein n=1 Tax=Myriangium duriaei CBS 260.36 TaxID=1168546 RepID=A0A9P4IY67_9PEZI|nr:hypothetical protein K461DRAFT_294670 [Myriangium duriaei CBS 260.36]